MYELWWLNGDQRAVVGSASITRMIIDGFDGQGRDGQWCWIGMETNLLQESVSSYNYAA